MTKLFANWYILHVFVVYVFSKINCIRMLKCLNSDQARRFVGPDLGPSCLERLSVGKNLDSEGVFLRRFF